jgi:3-hydroxybutyryl-CoA dehydrogenase/5-formyl-3-hydroxy-2-methylpyridine 4-carboxylate dehydrogenase
MRIAVIGMGSMGPGIAGRLSRGGHAVVAQDISADALSRAQSLLPMIDGALDGLGIADSGGSLRFVSDLVDAVAEADLVIENVPENIEIKAALYKDLERLIGEDVLLASDTSGIPITKLQAHVSHPDRFVGMHWSNPPHIIPMIEVIAGEATAAATVTAIRELIRELGLLPVVLKRDVPGFIENRVLYALLRECVDLVEQGVIAPEDLDTCVTWGIGYKLSVVGPMRLLDMAGLDIYHSVASHLNAELCDRTDVAPMAQDAIDAGRLGMKTGAGLFDYSADELASLPKERGAKLVAVRNVLEGRGST